MSQQVPTKKQIVEDRNTLDWDTLDEIVKSCGGFMRGSNSEGEWIELRHGDTEYTFKGEGLIRFLFRLKDHLNGHAYAALDLCDYIEDSTKQPPSKFVRDAVASRADELRRRIKGERGES